MRGGEEGESREDVSIPTHVHAKELDCARRDQSDNILRVHAAGRGSAHLAAKGKDVALEAGAGVLVPRVKDAELVALERVALHGDSAEIRRPESRHHRGSGLGLRFPQAGAGTGRPFLSFTLLTPSGRPCPVCHVALCQHVPTCPPVSMCARGPLSARAHVAPCQNVSTWPPFSTCPRGPLSACVQVAPC